MERRELLKLIAVAPAAASFPLASAVLGRTSDLPVDELSPLPPVTGKARKVEYNSKKEYGRALEFEYPDAVVLAEEHKQLMVRFLEEDARSTLPSGTVFEIRGVSPADFGRRQGYAWYSFAHEMSDLPDVNYPLPGETVWHGGYLLISRQRA